MAPNKFVVDFRPGVSCLVLLLSCLEFAQILGDTSMENVRAIWSRYSQTFQGDSTYYGNYPGGGACALDPLSPLNRQAGWIRVAAGKDDYQKSLGCGMCIEITGNGEPTTSATGGATPITGKTKAVVTDLCGGCQQGGFDFYIPGDGKWKTEFKAIECPTLAGNDDNIQFRFVGSNLWYIKLQARNSKVVTVGMEIFAREDWVCMKRLDDNYFTENGLGKLEFPMRVRVTSISGEQLEGTIPSLKNDVNIQSGFQYSGFLPASKPESIKCYGQGNIPGGGGAATKPNIIKPPAENAVTPEKETETKPSEAAPIPGKTPGTEPSEVVGVSFCKEKKDGSYPDPEDCASFIICSNGMMYKKSCPPGLKYNAKIGVCDWPRNVECPQDS